MTFRAGEELVKKSRRLTLQFLVLFGRALKQEKDLVRWLVSGFTCPISVPWRSQRQARDFPPLQSPLSLMLSRWAGKRPTNGHPPSLARFFLTHFTPYFSFRCLCFSSSWKTMFLAEDLREVNWRGCKHLVNFRRVHK